MALEMSSIVIVKPTTDLLEICEKYDARYTIFAEICEYWAFKEYSQALTADLGYTPHREIEHQLTLAIQKGHDVQLHLHPQWIGAKYHQKKMDSRLPMVAFTH